ncbi:GxGYxYP domain-containing protein [Parabacteroides faecalis]|uniref:GxGYxYP domain-containing protein n=1 Tax=Parabacteroides faecalis TaxID=2924040 RepID=UPI00374CDEA2
MAGNILCTKNVSPIVVFDMRYLLEKDLTDINNVEMVWDQLHLVSTLQGIVNRNKPSLFIKYVKEEEICVDEYWWNKYRKEGEWLSQRDTIQLTSLMDVLAYFKKDIKGLVVYDSDVPSTSNVAS